MGGVGGLGFDIDANPGCAARHLLLFFGEYIMSDNKSVTIFKPCEVVRKGQQTFFSWRMSDETKNKIRHFLGTPDLKFAFNATLETVPPHLCPECGIEITFFDTVRESVGQNAHGKDFIIQALQQSGHVGNGKSHQLKCENNHVQPIVMGWAVGFGWTYDDADTPADVPAQPSQPSEVLAAA